MELEEARAPGGEGCLVGVVRIPVKIVAVLIVLPVRVVWDLLAAAGRLLQRTVLGPLGQGLCWFHERVVRPVSRWLGRAALVLLKLVFVWPWAGLWRYVLVPVGQGLAWSGQAARAYLLAPVGRGIAWVGRALMTYLLRPLGGGVAWVLRGTGRYLLLPLAKGVAWVGWALAMTLFVWPWAALWRHVLVPGGNGLLRYLLKPAGAGIAWLVVGGYRSLLRPAAAGLYAYVLAPGARAVAWFVPRAFRAVFVWPWVGLWRHALVPAGRGTAWLARGAGTVTAWLGRALFVRPWVALWRYVVRPGATGVWRHLLAPVGRGVWAYLLVPFWWLLVGAWHLAGRVSRALGRGLVWMWRWLVVRPAGWVRRRVVTPVGNALRAGWAATGRGVRAVHRQAIAPVGRAVAEVWRAARLSVREARDDVRRALFGGPPREPARSQARTLGSNTAVGDAPGPDVSLNKQG